MKYKVDDWVFEKNPDVCFGIIIGKGLKNSETTGADSEILSNAEAGIREKIEPSGLKTYPQVAIYRDALKTVEINPNKFMNSVEAMSKRVVKSGSLPRINAMVDLCNAIALEEVISLGAHDLADIDDDLAVRLTKEGDKFRPFGSEVFENVAAGELVFTSGSKIQTRQWLWRQSELGKITLKSTNVVFQLVGFTCEYKDNFERAMKAVEKLIEERFGGTYESFVVDTQTTEIEFDIS